MGPSFPFNQVTFTCSGYPTNSLVSQLTRVANGRVRLCKRASLTSAGFGNGWEGGNGSVSLGSTY